MTAEAIPSSQWLERYGTNYHWWRTVGMGGRTIFKRPHGLVENFFSFDGADWEGRADLTLVLTLDCKHKLSKDELLERLVLAWASLRLQHVLLMARVVEEGPKKQRWFVVEKPQSTEQVLQDAEQSMAFMKEQGSPVDTDDFFLHCSNTARLIDPSKCLSKLFVLPVETLGEGQAKLKVTLTVSHEITDGMSTYNWISHLIRLLNTSEQTLLASLETFRSHNELKSRLPIAQEDMYPQIPGSLARQRWFWAIARVLRHVRKPLPAAFVNPLRKEQRSSPPLEPKYPDVLDYSEERRPPLNSDYTLVHLPPSAAKNFTKIVREAKGTMGAGCFALVALAMMELEEERYPGVPLQKRKPMIMSFPMNPKPYFGYNKPSESCMLAFGDNFLLPFLPSDLDTVGRFKLLLKQCQIKLGRYQKRAKNPSEKLSLAAYSPSRLLATAYISQLDAGYGMVRPNGLRRGPYNPQGDLLSARDASMATNGVSNVGSMHHFFDEKARFVEDSEKSKDLDVQMIGLRGGVRARDNEFLVGSMSDGLGLHFSVSYDASVIDKARVQLWKEKMENLLSPERLARL